MKVRTFKQGGKLRPAPGTNDPDYEDEGVMKPNMRPAGKPKPKPVVKPKPAPGTNDPDYEDEGVMKGFAKGGKLNMGRIKPAGASAKAVRASAPSRKPTKSIAITPDRRITDAIRNNMDSGGQRVPPQFKKGGMMKKSMKEGSPAEEAMDRKQAKKSGMSMKKFEKSGMDKDMPMKKFAKGGGIEKRGKTKGKMIAMACGGKMKGK